MHGIIKNTSNRESRERHEKRKHYSFAYFCVFRGKIFVFILPEIFVVLIGKIGCITLKKMNLFPK